MLRVYLSQTPLRLNVQRRCANAMRECAAWLITGASAACLCACDRKLPQLHSEVAAKDVESVEQIDVVTRLRVAEMRIGKLERQVIELQAAPANVETDILKQRLRVTEAALVVATQRENGSITSELPSVDRDLKQSVKSKPSSGIERDAPDLPTRVLKPPAPVSRLRLVNPKTFELQR